MIDHYGLGPRRRVTRNTLPASEPTSVDEIFKLLKVTDTEELRCALRLLAVIHPADTNTALDVAIRGLRGLEERDEAAINQAMSILMRAVMNDHDDYT